MGQALEVVAEVSLEADWDTFCAIEDEIGSAESQGIEARWRCGHMLLRYEKRERSKHSPLAEVVRKLSGEFGVSEAELYNRRQFAAEYPDCSTAVEQFRSWTDARDSLGKRTGQLIVASDENEWYTPPKYIQAAHAVLGGIDLDPASSAEANEIVGAARYFTVADNAFLQEWGGRVWLNPPYGGEAGAFVNRLTDEFYAGDVTAAIVLVNAHCTDTEWFRPLFNQLLCFTDHRIDFVAPAGREKKSSSTHGSVFAYFGEDIVGFVREFAQFGAVVRPV